MTTRQNFELLAGRDYELPVTLTEADGTTPIDLTGCTIKWEASPGPGVVSVLVKSSLDPLEIEITDPIMGEATIFVRSADTFSLGGNIYFHELMVIDPVLDQATLLQGFLSIGVSLIDADSTEQDKILAVSEFRAIFSAFSDPTLYPDIAINYWIGEAVLALDPVRWGQFYNQGLRLYVAHMLALDRHSARSNGGLGAGVPSSKSVGGVSISYDTQFGSETDGGAWNLTTYGQRYIRLARQAGAGGIQL
jgi:hypothetical protein